MWILLILMPLIVLGTAYDADGLCELLVGTWSAGICDLTHSYFTCYSIV